MFQQVEIQIELEDLDEDDVDLARQIPTGSNDPPGGIDPFERLVSEAYNRPDDEFDQADGSSTEGHGLGDDELDIEDLSSDLSLIHIS